MITILSEKFLMFTVVKNYHSKSLILSVILLQLFITACNKKVEVEVEQVQRRTLIAKVTESGVIQPETEVPIAPDVSGEITAIYVKEGQFVKQGELLFEIRPDNYQAALEQSNAAVNASSADYANSQAALGQAESNLSQDSINFFRNKVLFQDSAISKAEFESFQLRFNLSKSAYASAKQAVQASFYRMQSAIASNKQAKDNLQRTRVYASIQGTVTLVKAQVGQRVVGTGMMAGTEVIKIADLTKMEVEVLINENDIVNVHVGDSAIVTVDAYQKKEFLAYVSEVAYSASVASTGTTDQITNYSVKLLINPDSYIKDSSLMRGLAHYQSPFRPGMSAIVSIFVNKVENVLSVPIQAVTIDKNSDKPDSKQQINEIVYIYREDGTVALTPVVSGISDDNYIEIKSGLNINDKVVIGPYSVINKVLKDGLPVSIMKKESKSDSKSK